MQNIREIQKAHIQQNQTYTMEELYQQISERVQRVQEVTKTTITPERLRALKDQQKMRCEKENFILSMMRANKSVQIISKNLYYKYSYEIMRKINPEFNYNMNYQKLQENFLNDFVGLYRFFFYKYQEMFNFKMKIQNLIRPTNVYPIKCSITSLQIYRDYYQQTFFWYMKSHCKIQKIEEEQSQDLDENVEIQKQVVNIKKVGRSSLNQIVLQRSISKKTAADQTDMISVKRQPQKNYEILEIAAFPSISAQQKDSSTNLQVLKIRINDFYREIKSRNIITKANINSFYSRYFGENIEQKQKDYLQAQDEEMNKTIHPFKLTLNIQKNGFNYISVSYSDNKFYLKNKDKKLSPLKVSQRLIPAFDLKPNKQDFMLTSLKVIRISDSFLPPIMGQNSNLMSVNQTFTPETVSRMNLVSSNSAANEEQIQRKMKKQSQHLSESTNHSVMQERIPKQRSYRKLKQIKRNFKSEQKKQGGILLNSNNVNISNDPQKKIFDWLQKLRQVKEIERKKIMGLS